MKKTLILTLAMIMTISAFSMTVSDLKQKMHKQTQDMISSIKDIYIKQKSTSKTMNVEAYQTIYAKGKKAFIENEINYKSMSGNVIKSGAKVIANEKGTYMFIPATNNTSEEAKQVDALAFRLAGDMMGKLLLTRDNLEIASLIFTDYSQMIPDSAKIEKTEKVEGVKCYKLVVNDGQGNTMSIWVSKKGYVPVKIELKGSMNGTTQTQTTYFKKYKKVAGKMGIPYVMESYMNGQLMEKNEVVEMRVNKGIKDEVFNIQ